jgi:hypothetical protein
MLGVNACLMAAILAAWGAEPQPGVGQWIFASAAASDLQQAIERGGIACARFERPADAVTKAPVGAAVLVLADGYPNQTTTLPPGLLEQAAAKRLRLYVEYPSALPGVKLGPPQASKKERAVVKSDLFRPAIEPLAILAIHGCQLVPAELPPAARVHLVWAKVAGVDWAVFGLNDTPAEPLLFDYGDGGLVATTRLSNFVRGRFMPNEAWRGVWRTILGHLQPGHPIPELRWTPTVRPSYGRDELLPPDAEAQAVRRLSDWYRKARVLRHAQWPKAVLDRAAKYNTVLDPPARDWPLGDGSQGMLEGYSSTIRADGSQPMRYAVRNDCDCEAAMALALAQRFTGRAADGQVAANLIDYTWLHSPLVQGPRADPRSDSFGLIGWALDNPGTYYGDDNGRALLGGLAVARLQAVTRWDAIVLRCLEANLRTTGANGYRDACLTDAVLAKRGRQAIARSKPVMRSPHFEAWLWACFLWAYHETHHASYLTLTKAGFGDLLENYPDRWHWVIRSGQIERARALLPLAWLVRVDDTPEHRQWLRRIADDLLAYQDACGAIRERLGGVRQAVGSNRDYGTGEVSIIQQDGDPMADMLYTCNFAAIGLHEAAAATGEPRYRQAADRLAAFLCRIQIRSEAHPELDGAWYRAFDYRRWDYWGSNADWEWGPWCTETGWTQPWIAATLALRQMKTSLWELVTKTAGKARS